MTAQPVIAISNVSKSYDGNFALKDFNLTIEDGEFLTLLGPSGCGKTTILRLIGGFESCDTGNIHIDGRSMDGVPPEKRTVNTVFQSYALFPHMSVYENVAFGLVMDGKPESEIQTAVQDILKLVRLDGLDSRKPSELSGGQQQRVAIARAIVKAPRVLLLDEPLSALDYQLRKQMQKELKAIQEALGITFILVTHDQEEAFAMSDRVVVMALGRIEQVGTPTDIYEEPANLKVARFVGEINELDGTIIERNHNTYTAEVEGRRVVIKSDRTFTPGDKVHILLRPEDFRIKTMQSVKQSSEVAKIFNKTLLKGMVKRTYYKGATYDVDIILDGGKQILVSEFFDEDAERVSFHAGDRVAVSWFDGWEVILPHE